MRLILLLCLLELCLAVLPSGSVRPSDTTHFLFFYFYLDKEWHYRLLELLLGLFEKKIRRLQKNLINESLPTNVTLTKESLSINEIYQIVHTFCFADCKLPFLRVVWTKHFQFFAWEIFWRIKLTFYVTSGRTSRIQWGREKHTSGCTTYL